MSPNQPPSNRALSSRELHQTQDAPRQKRFKVGRACYTCRVKKIKCDGLMPCMQCKARRRPCSFSKDGTYDADSMRSEGETIAGAESPPTPGATTPSSPADNGTDREKNNAVVQRTTEILNRLSSSWPGQGREGNWSIDGNLLDRDPLDSAATLIPPPPPACADMPPRSVQNKLISLYFEHRHMFLPIIRPYKFHELLERPNGLATSLLLFSMFAHAAPCDGEFKNKADVYYRQAQLLLDDYLDIPRISTVAALCLLTLYEPKRKVPSRASLYLGMAFRMCASLGLLKRFGSVSNSRSNEEEMAWNSRVCWGCYCLDKLHSIGTGRPWTMDRRDIDLDFPFHEEDDKDEGRALEGYVSMIKLMQLYEQAADVCRQADTLAGSPDHERMTMSRDRDLLQWLQSLPADLKWTTDYAEPPQHTLAAHLSLLYSTVALALYRSYAGLSHTASSQRCVLLATQITHIMLTLNEHSTAMLSHIFAAYGVMAAVRIHVLHCANEIASVANNARHLFQQSLKIIQSLLQQHWIPGAERFVINLEETLSAANGTAFVVSHDNNKQQEWSKLDYLTHPVITPTVKSSGTKITYSPNNTAVTSSNEPFSPFATTDRLDNPPLGMDFGWPPEQDDRMEPSSVDTFLYRARSMLDQQRATTALLLDQQKLRNDSVLSVMPAHQERLPSSSSSSSSSSSLSLSWPVSGVHSQQLQAPSTVQTPQGADSPDNPLLYTMWPNHQSQPQTLQEPQPSATSQPPSYFQYQQPYMNIGLGVYASAHQHHNDVIRHHFASNTASRLSPPNRPLHMPHSEQVATVDGDTSNKTANESRRR